MHLRVDPQLELGSRNHDVVPVALIASISGMSKSVVVKILKELVRYKLISYETSMCMCLHARPGAFVHFPFAAHARIELRGRCG